jgi:hypothetical protein
VKRNPKRAKQRSQTLQVWTFGQAQAAIPYIASVVRSIREHALEALYQAHKARRLKEKPGRPDRAALIAQQEAEQAARRADDNFQEAVAELQGLDVYCLDPIQGQVLIPFVQDEQLAWYIFDLYDSPHLRSWRYQSDPEETRRPITAAQKDAHAAGTTRVV